MENIAVNPQDLEPSWAVMRPFLSIADENDYDVTVELLNHLVDEVGTDERHPLYSLLDTLGTLLHEYEERHHPIPECSGSDILQLLMDEHGLTQSDLPEVGSQGVVSEVLHGRRELNVRQIRALAKRFHVSPAVFI